MINLIKRFKDKSRFILLVTCIIYFVFKLIFYIKGVVFFDEGVYLGIAKYFAYGGQIGYFEYIRPLLLPVILTPFQWLPFNSLITGRIIGLLLMFMCILIVYYVTNRLFGEKAALWSAFLFATSASVIIFGGYILTDLPAFIFALLALSFVINKKYLFSGIVIGIGFLFKFPVPIIILPLIIYILLKERKEFLTPSIKLVLGFTLVSAPYFLFNLLYYRGSMFQRLFVPLINASSLIQTEIFIYEKTSILLYLKEIAKVETVPLILAIIASWHYFKKEKEKIVCFWACVLTFLFYFSFKVFRFDPRYVTSVIPFIAVLGGAGVNIILKNKKNYLKFILILFILLSGFTTSLHDKVYVKNDNYLKDVIASNKTNILTNTAFPIIYSNSKMTLMPTPNLDILYLTYKTEPDYNWLIINPDGFFCEQDNSVCIETLNNRLMRIIDNNNVLNCGYLHGSRIIILTKENSYMSKIDCLNKIGINYLESKPPETSTFFRIVISFDSEGDIENIQLVEKLIAEMQKGNISIFLTLESDDIKLSKNSEEFFRNLSNKIDIGVITNSSYLSKEFVRNFSLLTNKKISFIVPKNDEWKGKNISLPPEIKYCIDGSWDATVLPIPCKKTDLFIVKNWSTGEFYNSSELKTMHNSVLGNKIADNLYEIGIDVSTYALNEENFNKINNFIVYIANNSD